MAKLALFARLEAKPEKAQEVKIFLKDALSLAQEEPETTTWFALQFDETTFGIYDTFDTESGREAHLSGDIAEALMDKAAEYFSKPPQIEKINILAAKLPG